MIPQHQSTTSASSSIKFHFLSHTQNWISVDDQNQDDTSSVWSESEKCLWKVSIGKPWGYDIRWSHGENPIEAMVKFLWLKSTVCESWMETRASTHLHLIRDTAKIKSVSAHIRYKLSCTRDSYSGGVRWDQHQSSDQDYVNLLMRFNWLNITDRGDYMTVPMLTTL